MIESEADINMRCRIDLTGQSRDRPRTWTSRGKTKRADHQPRNASLEWFPFYNYSFYSVYLIFEDKHCFFIPRPSQWPTHPQCRLSLTPHPQLPPQSCAPRHTRKPPNFTSHDAYQKLSQTSNQLLRPQHQRTSTQMARTQHRLRRSPQLPARGGSRCGTSTSLSSAQ